MQFSNTSLKNGLIQDAELWTGIGDAGISGNTLLMAQFTALMNRKLEEINGKMNLRSSLSNFDDTNYTNQFFSTFNLINNQNDYQFLIDQDGNTITDITGVMIKISTTATFFTPLPLLNLDSAGVDDNGMTIMQILSPDAALSAGIPTGYIERNNTIFFNKIFNYNLVAGGKVFYKRCPSYFVVGDTTKTPGFQSDYHRLISMGASYDWLLINRPENAIITRLEARIAELQKQFDAWVDMRSPIKARVIAGNNIKL